MCVDAHTLFKLFAFLHWGFLDFSFSFCFSQAFVVRMKGRKSEKKRRCLMEPRAGAPWEWQPLPKIRRETKTRIKAKMKRKRDSGREKASGSFSSYEKRSLWVSNVVKRGVYFKVCYFLTLPGPSLLKLASFELSPPP